MSESFILAAAIFVMAVAIFVLRTGWNLVSLGLVTVCGIMAIMVLDSSQPRDAFAILLTGVILSLMILVELRDRRKHTADQQAR